MIRNTGTFTFHRGCLALACLFASQMASAESYQGELLWAKRAELGMPISGVVSKVHVEAGQTVKAGAALVSLQGSVFKSRVQAAKAELQAAESALAEADRELGRTQELYDQTLIADNELQLVTIAFDEAQARVSAAKRGLAAADYDARYSVLRAPYSAVILKRSVQPGQGLSNNLQVTPLLTIASAKQMLVRIHVGLKGLSRIQQGADVSLKVQDKEYTGKIKHIALEPDMSSGSPQYDIDIVFKPQNLDGLRAGLPVKVELP